MAKQKYVKIVRGGVRLTLSTNAWVLMRLACGYMIADHEGAEDALAVFLYLPHLPTKSPARLGKRWTNIFKPSLVGPLMTVMIFAESIRAGCLDGPRTNIGSALVFLKALGPIELLAAAAE